MMKDFILLLHPAIAVITVFPLLGIVIQLALKVRTRRIEDRKEIPASSGKDHTQMGRVLTGTVVGITLLALANEIGTPLLSRPNPVQISLMVGGFGITIAALIGLYRAKNRLWRAIFATVTGMSLVILGCQDNVYRNTQYWYTSHYYYGITAALLMIFALSIFPDIYRNAKWRTVHIVLNSIALLLFLGQSITGTRSLLEIPLHWQKPYVQQLYEQQCEIKPCRIQAP